MRTETVCMVDVKWHVGDWMTDRVAIDDGNTRRSDSKL